MFKNLSKLYPSLSIVFMILAIVGGMVLLKQSQDLRNLATDLREASLYPSVTPEVTAAQCKGANQACSSDSECCNSGSVGGFTCVAAAGQSRTCQQASDTYSCPGSTCSRYDGYHCSALTNGQCTGTNNRATNLGSWAAAVAYANGCGQADTVCAGGSREGQTCGGFQVFNNNCGTQTITNPPAATPTTPQTVTITPTATVTPTGTRTPTATNTPIPTTTSTPSPTSTSTPQPTSTTVPTATATPQPTDTPVPTATATPQPTGTTAPTATATPQPTSTTVPTSVPTSTTSSVQATSTPGSSSNLAEGPSPTRIVLPNAGVDFPLTGLTIVGAIITLLGLLVLL